MEITSGSIQNEQGSHLFRELLGRKSYVAVVPKSAGFIPGERCPACERRVVDPYESFIEFVRPFQRAVYLVAFAYTIDTNDAERIAVQTMLTAFKEWQKSRAGEEIRLWLIGVALSEARALVHSNDDALIDDSTEVLPDGLPWEGITAWRPIAIDKTGDVAFHSTLMEAIRELPRNSRVTLFLRDVLHFTTLETANLLDVSLDTIQRRLACGRIALCVKLAKRVSSGCDLPGQATFATAC